ncbi:IQ and ubiquitin-like domain-containing protein [Hemicordylus capensis]|uniref:IQ and ubiquitin-like domain-containing protein n=1 Tax=Hemicordylus capensis TaxID=884348 RepID=UPI002304CF26|nr:IQ and ubiquitin-like domain-containing protein [Hemicordylus capensis]XP_053107587.1 IQ and ubiquitin-like domain-containing protein [Hemicordylus capensis]XP_053107588.1 IQ and ubiquitin-like domain-containing protein [Hemicordylus capensis]XP_053107589.1 IQ and ubiquitin-like domain-containing protein [Hemicordylus capensis]
MADPEEEQKALAEEQVTEDMSVTKQTEESIASVETTEEQTDAVQSYETTLPTEQEQDQELAALESAAAVEPPQELAAAEEPAAAEGPAQWAGAAEGPAQWAGAAEGPAQWAGAAEGPAQWAGTAEGPAQWAGAAEGPAQWAGAVEQQETPLIESQDEVLKVQKPIADVQDVGAESEQDVFDSSLSSGATTEAAKDISEKLADLTAETYAVSDMLVGALASQRAALPEDTKNATATVKVMLHPDIQIFTMAFHMNRTMEQMKQYFATRLNIPPNVLQLMLLGRIIEDCETLWNLGVAPHGSIQIDMFSLDEKQFPIISSKLLHKFYMPDVINVRVETEPDTFQDLSIEIKRPTFKKPFLGGFRNKETGTEYHNAGSQTIPKKRPDKGYEEFCRSTQTVVERKKVPQTRNTTSTQMTKIGVYISNITDKFIEPKKYVTAEEYHARRLAAVIVIQTYYRRWHAINIVKQLKEELRFRLEWEEEEELRKQRVREERLLREYHRRLNPKTKDDFELLYHALEIWRQEEIECIDNTYVGAERKAALCAVLEKEAHLIASIGRHKLNADEENQQKAILSFLEKCAEPKRWKAFDGKITEMDTQFTLRARELLEIYRSISMKDLPQDERLDVLLTLKHTVKEHECKLTHEIMELIDREADLMMRGVKECNLEGLRQRICTLFLQYIKTPLFNPEVARLLKVPPDPIRLYHNIHFCLGCKRYLPSTDFAISATSHTVGRCRLCCKLDNQARKREAFLKYKRMLRNLRDAEVNYMDGAKIAFVLQLQDLQYMVENFWGSQSALSAWDDLYDLVMVRWDRYHEWSPWNTVLFTKEEAEAHLRLKNLEKAYEMAFIHRIKHKHMLARNYFSQFPELAATMHKDDNRTSTNGLLITKALTPGPPLK